MRKHSVRKWLHAILDLLPLFVIPIFAIYSRNENAQFGYEVTQEQMTYYESNEVETNTDLIVGNIYKWTNGVQENELQTTDMRISVNVPLFKEQYPNLANENITLVNILVSSNTYVYYQVYINGNIQFENISATTSYFIIENITNQNHIYDDFLEHVQYTNYKYEKGIYLVTYNDTDIGSQMIYTLYNTVDKYFNMNNVFNMGAIWNWVNNNMFSGSAPLSAYIVYQIIAYELIMDIIFLLYTVMMFIVDFAEKGIDRFMGRAC